MADKVLSVNNLVINFKTDNGIVQAVRDVSFDLEKGETLCIVGESGSGKSVTSKAIMGILANNAIIAGGNIIYRGENLLEVSEEEFHKIRGHKIGMIFQDPLSSLNPIVRIGKQITEATLINSDKLKLMYNDLISDDLIAYKNTLAKMKISSQKKKDYYQSLVNKTKKYESDFKNNNKTIKDGIGELKYFAGNDIYNYKEKIADAKHALNEAKIEARNLVKNARYEILEEQYAKIYDLKENAVVASKEQKNEIMQQIKVVTAEYKAKLANKEYFQNIYNEYLTTYVEKLNKDTEIYTAKIEERKEQLAKDIEEYKNTHILTKEEILQIKADIKAAKLELKEKKNVLKSELEVIKKEALAKAAPLKVKLDETKALAKAKVKEYKSQVMDELNQKLAPLKLELASCESEEDKKIVKEKIEKVQLDCINKLKITKAEAKRRALEIMKEVGIPEPERRFKQYPFEFSGGMRQRIVIAIALTAAPEILICDEPTTALDVTIQAQILELINKIKAERNLSCIFITHDLGVVANMADRVAVMYAGKIVEYGTAEDIFYDPKHPYTWALLSSIPDVDSKEKLDAIPGTPPNMIYPPKGDAFALRSKYAMDIDFKEQPPYFKISDTHYAATWLLDPRAPKVEMPKIVSERIKNSLKEDKSNE